MLLAAPAPNLDVELVDIVLLLLMVVAAAFTAQHRRKRRTELSLARGQRVVALQQQWLDPVVTLFVVVGVLRKELGDPLHLALAAVGVVLGAAAGVVRGRLIFLEARTAIRRVVLKRGPAEIAIVAVLVALAVGFRNVQPDGHSPLNLVATVVLTLGVAESVARTLYITKRYYAAARQATPAAAL